MREKKSTILTFSENFTSLLETGGLKQIEIADKAGVSRTSIIHWKSGRSIPSGLELYKLAKFFGCSMEWLLTGEDSEGVPNQAVQMWKTKAEHAERRIEGLKKSMITVIKNF